MKCSKIIWQNFCETYGIWTGPDAVWFEDCDKTNQITMDFTTWNYFSKTTNSLWAGAISPSSPVACWKLPLIGKSQSAEDSALEKFVKMSYDHILNYQWSKSNSDEKLNDVAQELPSLTDAFKSYLF